MPGLLGYSDALRSFAADFSNSEDDRCMPTATILEGCAEEVPCATLPQHLGWKSQRLITSGTVNRCK